MEWPKQSRTADWENGILTLDKEKQFEVPELTMELMEQLAVHPGGLPCERVSGDG